MANDNRRIFLGACLGGIAAATAATVLYPLYRYLAPAVNRQESGKVQLPESAVSEGKATFFQYAGASAIILRKRGGEIIAFSAVCTHLGCVVQWLPDAQQFLCPCHAGRYNADGAVVAGPPPKPLPRLPVTVSSGTITIG